MKKQFPDVAAAYGAPMGRSETLDNLNAVVKVFQVRMVDGDYDDGGAYWGGLPSEPLYCARSDEGDFEVFIRAKNEKQARATLLAEHPDVTVRVEFDLEAMLDAYLVCALWSSVDYDTDGSGNGEPFDVKGYCVDDFTEEAVAVARSDCEDFIGLCEREGVELLEPSQMGHDFWLTRNRHGAGFWDRGLGEQGEHLSKLAKTFGECHPWADDDGKVHFE